MSEPNFFIIGAPKCGTSAMHEYLAKHPQVFMTDVKEPHHFSTDMPGRNGYFCPIEYRELFKNATSKHLVRGESSVYYLYSRVALSRIVTQYPDAKFVAMLRNPIELTQSLHGQLQTSLTEDEPDFRTAWNLQEARARGEHLPSTCIEPSYLQYREIGLLGQQMRRALDVIDSSNLLTIMFDDFCRHPERSYAQVLNHLGLKHDGQSQFPRVNVRTALRYRWLRNVLDQRRLPAWMRRCGRRMGLHKLHASLTSWNEVPQPRPQLQPEFKRELASVFLDDVKLLSRLVGHDLSHWLST